MVSGEYPPWKVAQRLGTGTLTEAFLVDGPQGPAVLKRLLPFYAEHELLSAAFVLRGEEVRALDHPAILKVLATGASGRDRYIVMEKAEGRALSRAIARMEQKGFAALPQIPVVACAYQAAKALAYAHSRGVFHLDVSLHNLYLSASGHVRVADFGLAHTRRSYAPDAGSVELVPPEAAAGQKPDQRVDIWQLAAATYTLLAGGLPPNAHTRGFPPLNQRVEGADETLSALLMRSLSAIPAERPLAMAEVVAGLGTWLDRAGVTDAAAAAATLYRNLFEDSAEESSWSIPVVHPWPDAEGTPHKVFSAGESTPTSPKGPLAAPGAKSWGRWLLGGVGVGLALTALWVFFIGLRMGAPQGHADPAPPERPKKVVDQSTAGQISIGEFAQQKALPLSASKAPAEFTVSADRHGFFLEPEDGAQLSIAGMRGATLRAFGKPKVPALTVGESAGARRQLDGEGAFAILLDEAGVLGITYLDAELMLPPEVISVRAGFFTDRTGHRVTGSATVEARSSRGHDVEEVQLPLHPSIHLADDERFTLNGLDPTRTYALSISALNPVARLVVILRYDQISVTSATLRSSTSDVEGSAGQFLLPSGDYTVTGARSLLFTMPRRDRRLSAHAYAPRPFKVSVKEVAADSGVVATESR